MPERPITTLFLIESVDGKISSGDTDELDADADWKRIAGVKEGLHQYYEIESKTSFFSLNSGKVFAKIGFNEKSEVPKRIPVTFIVIDNKPHLNEHGVRYVSQKGERVIIVTTNKDHPAYRLKQTVDNVDVMLYESAIDFRDMMARLKSEYGAGDLTVQTGGALNAVLIRNGLIDYLSVVIAPLMVGGKDTPTLMDGESLHVRSELENIKALELVSCERLANSYLHVVYKVILDTKIDYE